MQDNKKIFHSNVGKIILDFLLVTLAVTIFLMCGLQIIESYNATRYTFFHSDNYFLCLPLGAIAAVIIQFFRFTVVSVSEEKVIVKRSLKKQVFMLDLYSFTEKTEYKKYGAFTVNKRYLIAKENDENVVIIRLYGFSAYGLYGVINEINRIETEQLDKETKDDIIRSSWENNQRFDLSPNSIISLEWKSTRFISFIFIAVTAVLVILLLFFGNGGYRDIKSLVIIVASFICIMEIPFEVIRTVKNSKRCPEYVEFIGEHLMIGEQHFIISDIEKITLTSADRKSSSVYPVQRYMVIKTYEGKYKFWLGSESSMSVKTYKKLCDFIWHAFVKYPTKLKFNGKHSLLNK